MLLLTYCIFEKKDRNIALSNWFPDQLMFNVDFILKFKSIIFDYMLIYFEKHLNIIFMTIHESESVKCNTRNCAQVDGDRVSNRILYGLIENMIRTDIPNLWRFGQLLKN